MVADRKKYIFNDAKYGKGRLVLAVIKQYINDFNPSLEELKKEFPSTLQGSVGVIISAEDLVIKKQNSKDSAERFFVKEQDSLTTSDGVKVYVSTEWGIGNIDGFIARAKELGCIIQAVSDPNDIKNNELTVKLSEGAVRNGYISIPATQDLFESKYFAENEQDKHVTLLTLIDEAGKVFNTCILQNRRRLKERFNAYFKSRNINPSTSVKFIKIDDGKFSMEFNADNLTIKELYEEYKNNPRSKWIDRYKERCAQLAKYKNKDPKEYDTALLKDIWRMPANGIADTSPGFMSKMEFDSLLEELPEITSSIVQNPSPETLDVMAVWAKAAKDEDKFQTIKWGVINRVFSAANPQAYSTILNESKVSELIDKLNKEYGLAIDNKGNWAEKNVNLMDAIKSQGLEEEDVFIVNTFAWGLYVSLVGKESPSSKEDASSMPTIENMGVTCQNIIYYGPPGTGKTYKLQELLKNKYTDKESFPGAALWLNKQLDDLSWFEIIVLVLLNSDTPMRVTDIISHEYYKIKAELNERGANLRATAWAALQNHAILDSATVKFSKRNEPLVFDKNKDSAWYIADSGDEQLEEYEKLLGSLKAGPRQADTIKRFEFVTFHQSYGYEEFIEGLRPVTNSDGDISYEVRPGVFKRICKRAESDPENQYALVIDEINRGNISKIFGELITLVEVDKRLGSENELTITLPYSGFTFSVPPNLDIIGTMNTADRSLTHIDIALRRRFDFKELRTDYSLVSDNVDGVNVRWMLYAINQRVELLLDREHILGHALLMSVKSIPDLKHAFKSNILPLLEEYFFENWDKINQVLNTNGFVEEKNDASSIWLGDSDDYAVKSFRINLNALDDVENYTSIYSSVNESAFEHCEMQAE